TRSAIGADQRWVPPGRIDSLWFQHPGVQPDAVGGPEGQKLPLAQVELRYIWERRRHESGSLPRLRGARRYRGRAVEVGANMQESFSVFGKQPAIPPRGLIADRPVLAASERNLVQIPRRRRRPRGGEEESSRLGIDPGDLVHVPFSARQLSVTSPFKV